MSTATVCWKFNPIKKHCLWKKTASAVKCKNERTEPQNTETEQSQQMKTMHVYTTNTNKFTYFFNRTKKNIVIIIIMIYHNKWDEFLCSWFVFKIRQKPAFHVSELNFSLLVSHRKKPPKHLITSKIIIIFDTLRIFDVFFRPFLCILWGYWWKFYRGILTMWLQVFFSLFSPSCLFFDMLLSFPGLLQNLFPYCHDRTKDRQYSDIRSRSVRPRRCHTADC